MKHPLVAVSRAHGARRGARTRAGEGHLQHGMAAAGQLHRRRSSRRTAATFKRARARRRTSCAATAATAPQTSSTRASSSSATSIPISLILNRSNGGKIRLVGAINTRWPGGICYVTKRNAQVLDDLKGLHDGRRLGSPVHNVVPAWLEMNGKPRDFIKLRAPRPGGGRRFAHRGQDRSRRMLAGEQPRRCCEAGQDGGGEGRLAEVQRLRPQRLRQRLRDDARRSSQKKPEMVRKFLHASYRGYEFARSPTRSRRPTSSSRCSPTVDRGIALAADPGDRRPHDRPAGARTGVSAFCATTACRRRSDFVDKAFDVAGKIKLDDIYTNGSPQMSARPRPREDGASSSSWCAISRKSAKLLYRDRRPRGVRLHRGPDGVPALQRGAPRPRARAAAEGRGASRRAL